MGCLVMAQHNDAERSVAPFEPGPLSLALLPTNLKSTVGQCRGRGTGQERSRKGEKPTAARKPQEKPKGAEEGQETGRLDY